MSSIEVFIGPESAQQPQEDTTDKIAEQFNFKTLVEGIPLFWGTDNNLNGECIEYDFTKRF
jgi:hypothetical protein